MRRYLIVGGERLIRIPVGILIAGLASRALGLEDFGLYTTVMVLLTVLTPFASFGLESLGIAMAARRQDGPGYLRDIAAFRLLTGILASCLFMLAVATLPGGIQGRTATAALAAASAVLVLRIYELGENVLFAQDRLSSLAAVRIIALVSAGAVTAFALLAGAGLNVLLVLSAAEALLLVVLYSIVLRREIVNSFRRSGSGRELMAIWNHVRLALPVFTSGVLVLILLNADKLLVFWILGEAESGLYNASAKLVDVLFFIPMTIGASHAASFARAANAEELRLSFRGAMVTATLVTMIVAVVVAALSPWIVPLLYGVAFESASAVLAILAPSLVAVTWVSLRTRALVALDRTREILRLTVLAGILHLPFVAAGAWIGTIESVAAGHTLGWMIAAVLVPMVSRAARTLAPWPVLRSSA
jgi:O-antigen/teichoic acid export membrane protein